MIVWTEGFAQVNNPCTSLVFSPPLTPSPSVRQFTPSHLAMQLALLRPPAVLKSPATNKLSSQTASARTVPLTPLPMFVQILPTSLARYLTLVFVPAAVKSPPMYKSELTMPKAVTPHPLVGMVS